jgi:hypothetical protein
MNWIDKFNNNIKQAFEILYDHNQPRDELGRWVSTGGGISFIDSAIKEGGFSYQPITKMSPTSGVMVSLDSKEGFEKSVALPKEPKARRKEIYKAFQNYIRDNIQVFKKNKNLYAGGWLEGDSFCFDISENFPSSDMKKVVTIAKQRRQRGVYNIDTNEYILEGDYGKYT